MGAYRYSARDQKMDRVGHVRATFEFHHVSACRHQTGRSLFEFAECLAWWGGNERLGRVETERAWRVDATTIADSGWNLDLKNPNRPDELSHHPPAELIAELVNTEREVMRLLGELEVEFGDVR